MELRDGALRCGQRPRTTWPRLASTSGAAARAADQWGRRGVPDKSPLWVACCLAGWLMFVLSCSRVPFCSACAASITPSPVYSRDHHKHLQHQSSPLAVPCLASRPSPWREHTSGWSWQPTTVRTIWAFQRHRSTGVDTRSSGHMKAGWCTQGNLAERSRTEEHRKQGHSGRRESLLKA
jgi:hypothetical protein